MRVREGYWSALLAGAALFLAPWAQSQPAAPQLLTLDFLSRTNGMPQGSLIQASDGNLYGTTTAGGAYYNGTVFKVSLSGTFTLLASFGANPCQIFNSALIQGSDGNFYGTTTGGANCDGMIYRMTPAGAMTTLYTFSGPDGALPGAALVQAANGTFYGTTFQGGANNAGVVFSLTASGAFTTLVNFNGTNGASPSAALVIGTDGNLYGTTSAGGPANAGTIFKMTPAGTLTTLYSFAGTSDGFAPNGLIQASNGSFYGTTSGGGPNGCPMLPPGACGGNVSSVGTIFSIGSTGSLATLYSFAIADGQNPAAALVQASNGLFYGTTAAGGVNNYGTVFAYGLGIPFPPSGLTATSGSSGVVTLSWESTGSSAYNVYGASSGSWQNNGGFNPQPAATTSGTSATISNLAPGSTYYFAVAASGASGTSGLSDVVTIKTAGNPNPPYWNSGGGVLGPWLLAALLCALSLRMISGFRTRRARAGL
jgi:uncharacterized repeat protein (TIGR03803 family)